MKLIYFVSITICILLSIDDALSQQQKLVVSCDVLYQKFNRVSLINSRSNALHAFCGFVQVALFKRVALHVATEASRASIRTI